MKDTAVKVRVDAPDAAAMERIAAELERFGMTVRHKMPALGLVTGDVDATKVEVLMAIDGVEAIEPEGSVRLPPFDEDAPQ